MKFPPVKLSPGYFDPPDNYSWIISPWTTAPRTINSQEIPSRAIIPRTFPPMQLPLNNSHLGNCSPDNYPLSNSLQDSYPLDFFPHTIHNYLWKIPPWTTTPQTVASNGSPPQGQLSPRLLPSRPLHLNNLPLEHKPSQTQLPPPPFYKIFPGIIISRRTVPSRQFPTMKFLLGQLPPDIHLLLNNSPWLTNPRQLLLFIKFPPWKTNEKCFELRHFEFKLHFIETSIATGDPSTGGIANSLLTPWQFCTLFKILFGTHF